MEKHQWLIWTMLLLVAVVTGCHRAPRYDSRLVAADSLMHDYPDSALAIIDAVSLDSLATEADHAYRDLLITQARYKCYIVATTDSEINRALSYYQRHNGEREKLTRAYIYKGAVMEELGHPDSAMLYYKHAEATADEKDYSNLAQINIRIAALYRIYYADKQTCYDKYKKALQYSYADGNKELQLNCPYNMGMCSGITLNENSKRLLDTAAILALELNDSSVYYECREMTVRQSAVRKVNLSEAKSTAQDLILNYKKYLTPDIYLDLAHIYEHESRMDSAKYFLGFLIPQCEAEQNARIKVRFYSIMADIAKYEGNIAKSNAYLDSCKHLSDSISNNEQKYLIQSIENEKNNEQIAIIKDEKIKQQNLIWIVGALLAITIISFFIHQYRKNLIIKSILRDIKKEKVDTHETFLQRIHDKESSIELLVHNMVTFIQCAINTAEHDSPAIIRKRIKESIHDVINEDFWNELRAYLDKNHNNIISNIAKNPRINDTDIRFIELVCCGFSYIEIAITLGYSANYVSNKRMKIQRKLRLHQSLNDYLNQEMTE